jgi:hypothetical protein
LTFWVIFATIYLLDKNKKMETLTLSSPEPAPVLTEGDSAETTEVTDSLKTHDLREKAKRIVKGEGIGTALEAGLMAAGMPLPARELAGVGVDIKTYGSHGHEKASASKLRKIGHAAGFFALNLAAGYALQKGLPAAEQFVGQNVHNGVVEGGFQVAGKVGVMASATPVLNRRFRV